MQTAELNKSIDSLIDEVFGPIKKASENFSVANASKTTADAVMAEAPGSENDESRGAGRPKDVQDVPKTDKDGNRAKGYEAIQEKDGEVENPEANQAGDVSQISSEGRLKEGAKMKQPIPDYGIKKSITEDEYAEFQAFKKAQVQKEELKKSEALQKAQTDLIKATVESALAPLKKENESLRKSLAEQGALVKAIASQPRQPKSITGIDSIEKSLSPEDQGPKEFTKSEKMDVAEALVKAKKIPMEVAIELENTGTVYNTQYRRMIEQELEKQN